MELTLQQKWLIGVATGVSFLLILKKYFAGGQCTIEKNLGGKVAVITGGNTGIGKETARKLVEMGCDVIIGARDEQKNQRTVNEFLNFKKGDIVAFHLDLSKKQSIEEFVDKVRHHLGDRSIDYLINNAGVMMIPSHKKTDRGAQFQIGVNHLGHFYLTYLIWPKVKSANIPRVINVSSRAHIRNYKNADIDFEDLAFDVGYHPMAAYSRSKKANILFSKQLQKKMDEKGIEGLALSLHPGAVRTELTRQFLNTAVKKIIAICFLALPSFIFLKSAMEGAQTTLYTVLEDKEKLEKGQYYVDCKKGQIKTEQCNDIQSPHKLWIASQKYWGIKFDL